MRLSGFLVFLAFAWFVVIVGVKLSKPFLDAKQMITQDRFNYHDAATRDRVERGQ